MYSRASRLGGRGGNREKKKGEGKGQEEEFEVRRRTRRKNISLDIINNYLIGVFKARQ